MYCTGLVELGHVLTVQINTGQGFLMYVLSLFFSTELPFNALYTCTRFLIIPFSWFGVMLQTRTWGTHMPAFGYITQINGVN